MSGSTGPVPPITVTLAAEAATIPPDTLGSFSGQFTNSGVMGADSVSASGGATPLLTVAASLVNPGGADPFVTSYADATVTQSFEVLGAPGPVTVDFVASLAVSATSQPQPGENDWQVFTGVVAPDGTRTFVQLFSNSIENTPTPALAILQPEVLQTGKVYGFQAFGDAEVNFSATTQGSASATVVVDPSEAAGTYSVVFGADPACFVVGTRILTTRGEVRVEDLAEGDVAVTASGGQAPIRWIGRRRIDCARHPAPERVRPVRVLAGAVAPGVPRRDLLLSPEHALLLDGVLIPARELVNGVSIVAEDAWGVVHYRHVELTRHDVLLAEGLAAESYLDTGNRDSYANAPVVTLRPVPRPTDPARACAPMVLGGPTLEAVRARLLARATREDKGVERTLSA